MENEIKENIKEVISLMSKCYSIQTVNNKNLKKSKRNIQKLFKNKSYS